MKRGDLMIYFVSVRLAKAYIDRHLNGCGVIRYDNDAKMYYVVA